MSRKDGERVIAGDVVVQVLEARRGRCRLRIQAPRGTPILRSELQELPRMASLEPVPDLDLEMEAGTLITTDSR